MRHLRDLVSIRSVFGEEKEIGKYLQSELLDLGFNVSTQEVEDGRFNVLATRDGQSDRTIGFYGHMDTVPVQGEWSGDPFSLREEGDKLIGLGAYDMKAGISAILDAAQEDGNANIRIAFGVDEENNSEGAYALVESGFFKGCEIVMVPEINDSKIQRDGTILLGRRGRSVYDIHVKGQSAHAATGEGINAISEAAKLITHLDSLKQTEDPILGRSSHFISMIEARAESLSFPDQCRIILDRHLVGNETVGSALELLRSEIKDLGLRADVDIAPRPRKAPYLEPYSVPKDHPSVEHISGIVSGIYDEIGYAAGASVADECVLAKDAPVIGLGPIGANAHREDEWVSRRSLHMLCSAYQEIVRSW